MSDDDFPMDTELSISPRAVIDFLRPKAALELCPEQRALYAAEARLRLAQARREEVAATREEQAFVGELPVPLLERLPGRFDMIVIGSRGSGKTRAVAQLGELYLSAARDEWRLPGQAPTLLSYTASWPDWRQVKRCLLVVDEAGSLMESQDGEVPPQLTRIMSVARHLEVSLALVAQHSSQIPPAIFRQGVSMLVTGTPWSWRAFGRKEVITRLDAAEQAIAAGRRHDPRSVAFVSADGFVSPVVVLP